MIAAVAVGQALNIMGAPLEKIVFFKLTAFGDNAQFNDLSE